MPYDGAGNFTRTPGTRIANAGPLVSAQVNDETDNLVTGINGKVNLDGKLTMTGLQTLYGDGTSALHGATVQQVQKGILGVASAVAGTVDAIQVTMSPASTTWTSKEHLEWVSAGANTITTPTISKDGGTTNKTIVSADGSALAVGATGASGFLNRGYYDGTNVRLISSSQFNGGTATTPLIMSGKDFRQAKSANVASAATTDIWTPADGNFVHITGTTTITSLGTAHQAGEERTVVFDGALTLTHNATTLILPGAANITTAAGDSMIVRADTTANMKVISYTKANGQPLATSGGMTLISTVTTNSGNTITFSGLTLTNYKFLRISYNNTKTVNAGNGLTFNSINVSAGSAGTLNGIMDIDLSNGSFSSTIAVSGTASNSSAGASGLTTASTSITQTLAGTGGFTSGTATLYGIA